MQGDHEEVSRDGDKREKEIRALPVTWIDSMCERKGECANERARDSEGA